MEILQVDFYFAARVYAGKYLVIGCVCSDDRSRVACPSNFLCPIAEGHSLEVDNEQRVIYHSRRAVGYHDGSIIIQCNDCSLGHLYNPRRKFIRIGALIGGCVVGVPDRFCVQQHGRKLAGRSLHRRPEGTVDEGEPGAVEGDLIVYGVSSVGRIAESVARIVFELECQTIVQSVGGKLSCHWIVDVDWISGFYVENSIVSGDHYGVVVG